MILMFIKIALLAYFAILMLCAVLGIVTLALYLLSGAWAWESERDDMYGIDDMGNGI